MGDERRAILFGLRTNVRFFASRRGFASLDVRLKTLALLYDEVVFEDGVYECAAGEGGSSDWVDAYKSPDQLKPRRTRKGNRHVLRMAPTGSTDFRTVLDYRAEKEYRSQFVTTLKELAPLRPKWAHAIYFMSAPDVDAAAKKLAREWAWRERELVKDAMPDVTHFLRSKVHDNLNLDLARSAVLGTHLAPDGLHQPLLTLKAHPGGVSRVASGERPLLFAMPELAHATWSDVCEIRESKGFQNLRAKMRELDGVALTEEGVRARLRDEYQAELERRKPTWWQAGRSLASFVAGFVPIVGPLLDAWDAAKAANDARTSEAHWTAVLGKARKRLGAQPPPRLAITSDSGVRTR